LVAILASVAALGRSIPYVRGLMAGCCNDECELETLRERQSGTLRAVLIINAFMFFVIVGAGIHAGSTDLPGFFGPFIT
jgi:hypothetical protein